MDEARWAWGRIKFYFDDEETPRIDMDADELFSGRHAPFKPPFVYHAFQSTGGYVSYLPYPFQGRLEITTEHRVGFYNAYYHTYAPDRVVETWTGKEDLSALERTWTRVGEPPGRQGDVELVSGRVSLDAPAMPDGEPVPSRKVLLDLNRSGVITSLRFSPLFPLTAYQLQHIVLRISWDGEDVPSVDAPLGSFFGSGLGEASVRAAPLGMSPSGPYYCYLPMPFWRQARIELVNENPEKTPEIWWEASIAANDYPEEETGYFNARYRREWPTREGEDYRLVEAEGRGTYVGQVMTVEPLRAEIKRWWEGDLRIYLDGQSYPAFHGTGHEDEYLGGWSNEWLMNPYSLPMHGEPKTDRAHPSRLSMECGDDRLSVFRGWHPVSKRHQSLDRARRREHRERDVLERCLLLRAAGRDGKARRGGELDPLHAAGSVGILASPAETALQSPNATRGGGLDQRPLRRLVVHGSDERV